VKYNEMKNINFGLSKSINIISDIIIDTVLSIVQLCLINDLFLFAIDCLSTNGNIDSFPT